MKPQKFFLTILAACLMALLSAGQLLRAQEERGAGVRMIEKGQRVALVIGNAEYDASIGKLKNPVNDATDMAAALKRLGFKLVGGKAHLNLSKRQMLELVREFGSQLQGGVVGLFYFAGHGVQVDKRNYLIPIAESLQYQEDAEFEAVDVDQILRQMEYAENALNILVLDACRNNNLPKKTRSTGNGLSEPQRKPSGVFIAYAARDGQTAAENPSGRNGLYTQELLKYLETPNLRLEDIFISTRREVKRLSNRRQEPIEYGSLDDVFYFKSDEYAAAQVLPKPSPNSAPSTNRPNTTIAPLVLENKAESSSQPASSIINSKSAESALWQEVEKINTISAYEKYLSEYPNGEFEKFARLRLGNLKWVNIRPTAQKFLKYNFVGSPSEDLLLVMIKDKFGFVNISGKEIIPAKFDYANPFSEGLAVVGMNSVESECEGVKLLNYGYINKLGRIVIPIRYFYAFDFSQGLAGVADAKFGFINKSNRKVISFKYDFSLVDCLSPNLSPLFKNDLAPVLKESTGRGKAGETFYVDTYGFIDKTGKEIIPLKYDFAGNFSEGLAVVWKDGKTGFINEQGTIVIPLQFDSAVSFSEGLAIVKQNNKWHLIDNQGKIINSLNLNYEEVGEFSNGLARVFINNKFGFINRSGKEIILAKYDSIWCAAFEERGFIGVELNGKKGFVDLYGNEYFDF